MKNSKEIDIAQKLIRCKSIAPKDGGTLRIVEKECKAMGFKCTKLRFSEKGFDTINNLYAEIGNGKPHFSFAGHVDIVPADKKEWKVDPFEGKIVLTPDSLEFSGATIRIPAQLITVGGIPQPA